MVNAAGESSSSRRKRQRVPSIVEDEAENSGGDAVARSGTLFELDLLDCSICCNALTIPVFQCDNGHIACSSCCTKMRKKCPSCNLPIGHYRSRIMEKIVKAIIVPCPNAKHGCTEKFSYGEELIHEKKCSFALCYCPVPKCNYSGVYEDLYSHYAANHKNIDKRFRYGSTHDVCLKIEPEIYTFQEYFDGPLVVIQCFKEPHGMLITVSCIAPSAPGVVELSYNLSYSFGDKTMTFELKNMNKIQKVSFQTPDKDFMLVPDYFLSRVALAKGISICIRRIENEAEAEEEEEEEEEDDEAEAEQQDEDDEAEAEQQDEDDEAEAEQQDEDDEAII